MSIGQLNIFGKDKVEVAIERFKTFEPPEGYYVAFSGGKDSSVILELAKMSGVKFDAHYTLTSVDPPELVQFIKREHPEVDIEIPRYPDNYKNERLRGKQITMWNLIPEKKMPPTRIVRYCCKELKESRGEGRFVVTGVRWQESSKRANRGGLELAKRKTHRMENFDPDNPDQEMIHQCMKYARRHLNPIIDWTTDEVWEFIHKYNVPYCKLYDEGYTRLGCIGCPMGSVEKRTEEFERYPKYKQAYIRAFQRMIDERDRGGYPNYRKTGEELERSYTNGTFKAVGGGTPNTDDSNREVRLLDESKDLVPAEISYKEKKIQALPKWENGSTGEEVIDWWIR